MDERRNGGNGNRPSTPPPPLDLTVGTQGPLATMTMGGELDLFSIPELEGAVRHLNLGDAKTLVVDLTDVTFVDSSVIAWLVRTHEHAHRWDCTLVAVIPRDTEVDRIVSVTRIDEVVTVARDAHGVASS